MFHTPVLAQPREPARPSVRLSVLPAAACQGFPSVPLRRAARPPPCPRSCMTQITERSQQLAHCKPPARGKARPRMSTRACRATAPPPPCCPQRESPPNPATRVVMHTARASPRHTPTARHSPASSARGAAGQPCHVTRQLRLAAREGELSESCSDSKSSLKPTDSNRVSRVSNSFSETALGPNWGKESTTGHWDCGSCCHTTSCAVY